jgi:hypothetical protein
MRNRLFLLTAALVLSACADDSHTTGPASRSGVGSRSASGDVAPSGEGIKLPDAKPAPQVGFTKITVLTSVPVNVSAGEGTGATETCPAGSTAIGGTYNISSHVTGATAPWLNENGLDGSNGWRVGFWNDQVGASGFNYTVSVYCAS